ncbi:DUF968 domain-containing protein [Escherichia coli]|nr:DUF968 domain-containing protein [Escherichia coli]
MRVLLRPVLVPELGLVVVKPDRESMPVFHNTRVLVEPEPKSMRNLPSGVVPAVRQPLVEDKTLLPFFSNARVIRAAGGAGALSDWLLRHIKSCQWPHGDYHHSETVIHRYGMPADDPHHLIGHGQGGMGTKAHDLFVLPLCRKHHDELHTDTVAFEEKYGSQLELIFRFIDRALAIGVLA